MENYIVIVYSGLEWENAFFPCRLKTAFSLSSLDTILPKLALLVEQGILKEEEEEEEDPWVFFFSVLLIQDGKGKPIYHQDLTIGEYRFFLFNS